MMADWMNDHATAGHGFSSQAVIACISQYEYPPDDKLQWRVPLPGAAGPSSPSGQKRQFTLYPIRVYAPARGASAAPKPERARRGAHIHHWPT